MGGAGPKASDPVRAFVALDLQDELRGRLADLVGSLRSSLAGVRWVRPEGIHLTLRFLGRATREQIAQLSAGLQAVARAQGPIGASAGGLGLFPARGRPSVVWLGLTADESLPRLQASCEAAVVSTGFPPERRPFRPHLTLGRYPDRAPRPTLPAVDLGRTRLETLTLFQSEPGPGGSTYSALARWRLG